MQAMKKEWFEKLQDVNISRIFRVLTLIFFLGAGNSSRLFAQFPPMSPNTMNNVPQNMGSDKPPKKDEPPHGGEIKDVGKYFIEIVYDAYAAEEKLNVFLMKPTYKAVDLEKVKGKVKIKYTKIEKEEELELIVAEGHFYCNVTDSSQPFTAFIVITVKGKDYTAVFNARFTGMK